MFITGGHILTCRDKGLCKCAHIAELHQCSSLLYGYGSSVKSRFGAGLASKRYGLTVCIDSLSLIPAHGLNGMTLASDLLLCCTMTKANVCHDSFAKLLSSVCM